MAAKSEMMGMTTVFNASGVDKEDFVKYTEANPATYRVRQRQRQRQRQSKTKHGVDKYTKANGIVILFSDHDGLGLIRRSFG